MGSFVPAKVAHLGLCDFLFSRLGASDDILKGQSTFMVEMAETAEILRHATNKSLIILDEVGRGTSTYDGLSIAWGLVEHFIETTKALTLFATHYHELIEIADQNPAAKNLTVDTISHKGQVQFLYRLVEKAASQSFGIYVASLAGLPQSVLKRSQEILNQLETGHHNPVTAHKQEEKNTSNSSQLCFLPDLKTIEIPLYLQELERELSKMDVMKMTPIDALIKLNQLKTHIELN
jgi:DNA mismatch repair protein MutS